MARSGQFPSSSSRGGFSRRGDPEKAHSLDHGLLRSARNDASARTLAGVSGEIVCYCNDLCAADLEKKIKENGWTSVQELVAQTHKNEPCNICLKRMAALLARVNETEIPIALAPAKGGGPVQAAQAM